MSAFSEWDQESQGWGVFESMKREMRQLLRRKMLCSCGFQFSGPGEFRNCEAFITEGGHSGVVCPKCESVYVNERDGWHKIEEKS